MPYTERWIKVNHIYFFELTADITLEDARAIDERMNEIVLEAPPPQVVHYIFDLRRVWRFVLTLQQIREVSPQTYANLGIVFLIGNSHTVEFITHLLAMGLRRQVRYVHNLEEALTQIHDYEP